MNLQEQLGALETGVEQLIRVATASVAVTREADAEAANADVAIVADADVDVAADVIDEAEVEADVEAPVAEEPPTLHIDRPSQNEITMSIGGKSVTLHPAQLAQLIEELSNARASMQPEVPPNIPSGWRFVSTKNPMMAVQKQSNGDRLLVMRHTGHGWVPFQFSPDMVIQMYMMLTQK
jgi:hypothetical protein